MPDPTGESRKRRYVTRSKWYKTELTYYVQPGLDLPAVSNIYLGRGYIYHQVIEINKTVQRESWAKFSAESNTRLHQICLTLLFDWSRKLSPPLWVLIRSLSYSFCSDWLLRFFWLVWHYDIHWKEFYDCKLLLTLKKNAKSSISQGEIKANRK